MRQMSQSSIKSADNYERLVELVSSLDDRLNSIDENLSQIASGKGFMSQSAAADQMSRNNTPFGDHHALQEINENLRAIVEGRGYSAQGFRSSNPGVKKGQGSAGGKDPFAEFFSSSNSSRIGGNALDRLLGSFEKSVTKNLTGNKIDKFLDNVAKKIGTTKGNLPETLGDKLGKMFSNDAKNDKLGGKIFKKFNDYTDKLFDSDKIGDIINSIGEGGSGFGGLLNSIKGFAGDVGGITGKFIGKASGLLGIVDKVAGANVAAFVAMKMFETAVEGATTTLSGVSQLFDVLGAAANRWEQSREKNLELANKRLREDINTLVEEPFEILKKSANEVYEAWNSNIRLIGQTQGYNKANLQGLMSAYATRLQTEGLDRVISSTDIYSNLGKVIQSGLSGNAAVEFAYQATKYNAAIPTQDFFNLVDSYASVVANAVSAGKSENEALQIANRSLEDFSNNLLYASRALTGGYSTGLKSADTIYSSSVKIAQAAKSSNIGGLTGALLAVQSYVGAVAPDLAQNLSDRIYQLATGGNSADVVALRSLAGTNASNTEFLRSLSQNPQAVLSRIFANLGAMFSQSPDAYMEKAEGYASLFGLSAESFQRIDFMSLAAAIQNMNSNSNTLDENMKLLKDGQSTTSADQLKIAQINKYMIEEGLAYVIDNEAAQLIQQHMWDEQLAREIMEAEYGVNIVGGAQEALQKIVAGIDKVLSILNPAAWLAKIFNVVETISEGINETVEITEAVKVGLVGTGNRGDLYALTTRNTKLNLVQSYVEMMGGTSKYKAGLSTVSQFMNYGGHLLEGLVDGISALYHGAWNKGDIDNTGKLLSGLSSSYSWGSISKNSAALARQLLGLGVSGSVSDAVVGNAYTTASTSAVLAKQKVDKMLSDEYLVEEFVKKGKSYEDWVGSSRKLGITNVSEALANAGYSESSIQEYFSAKQTEAGMQAKAETAEQERIFREAGINFMNNRFWSEYKSPVVSLLSSAVAKIEDVKKNQIDWKDFFSTSWIEESWKTNFVGESGYFTRFFDAFVKKFVTSVYYNGSGYSYSDVTAVQRKENAEKGDAVYALAEALTSNLVNLKDPQVQTNALLAQILVITTAIMNQNDGVASTISLSDSLSGLALGITKRNPITDTGV